MSYVAGLFGGLNERRAKEEADSRAEQDRLSGLETNLLMQLAQGDDPEIAALAGAGLLETISGNSKIGRAKGLQGFLGTAQRSSFLPGIKSVLDARRATMPQTPGTPGGAALPPGSPVEPKAQGAGASLPPMPPAAYGGLRRFQADFGAAPETGGESSAGPGLPQQPAAAGGAPGGVVPPGPPGGLGTLGSPALPAPPETPAAKSARLFPSARETAEQQAMAGLMAKYQAALAGLQMAGSDPLAQRLVMGINGAPLPQLRPTAVNLDYIDPTTGMLASGVGVMGDDGAVEVDGVGRVRPVGDVRPINQRPGAPIKTKRQRMNPDGTGTGIYDDVVTVNGVEQLIEAGMPVNTPPVFSGGNVDLGGGKIGRTTRDGKVVEVGRENPPQSTRTPAAGTTESARTAKAYYATLQARMKEELTKLTNPMNPAPKALPPGRLDALTNEVTRGQYRTYESLQRGIQGLAPDGSAAPGAAGASGPPAFGSPEGASAIDAALAARRTRPRP